MKNTIFDVDYLTSEEKIQREKHLANKDAKNSAVGQEQGITTSVKWQKGFRTLYEGPDSTAIVMDRDPYYGQEMGGNLSGRIFLTSNVFGKVKQPDAEIKNPSRSFDSSFIEISARQDPAKDYNLVSPYKEYKAVSAITAKADVVQIVAREGGLNLYAGGVSKYNSKNELINTAQGINLIFGNNISDPKYNLEPIPKGKALIACISDLIDKTSELASIVAKMHNEILEMKSSIATHTHIVGGVGGGVAAPSTDFLAYSLLSTVKDLQSVTNNLAQSINFPAIKLNYLEPQSDRYILSRWNKVN